MTEVTATKKRGRPKAASRKIAVEGDARSQILAGACRAFAQLGFEGASLQRIATELGLAQPLIHYYFDSKLSLWQSAVESLFDRIAFIMGTAANAATDLRAIDRLKLLVRGLIELTTKYPDAGLMLLNETRTAGPRLDWLSDKYLRGFQATIDTLITEAIERSEIRSVDVISFSNIILSVATQVSVCRPLYKSIYQTTFSEDDLIKRHADQVMMMLFSGIVREDSSCPER